MYTKLITILILFASWSNPSIDKMYAKEYDDNGNLKAEGWVKNESKINYWKFYHDNGILASEGHYENNEKSGYWHFYSRKGEIIREGHYNDGIVENWWIFHDLSTNKRLKIQYHNNQKNGFCLVYNGSKLEKVEKYENDLYRGMWTDLLSFKRDNPEVSL